MSASNYSFSKYLPSAILPGYGILSLLYNEKLPIAKSEMPGVPTDFYRSNLSLLLGAKVAYRDMNLRDSIHLREYEDHWTAEIDQYNPEVSLDGFIGHALTDALPLTVLGIIGLLVICVRAK